MSSGQPEAGAAHQFDLDEWLAQTTVLPPIVQVGDKVLRQPARDVPNALIGTPALHALVSIMIEVMRRAPGVGLAAPQIGVPLRLFVAEDPPSSAEEAPGPREERGRVPLPLKVLINPSVVPEGDAQATFYEGCLSMRGYGALVPRWYAVRVNGLDHEGNAVALALSGWPARIMQHEMDHLEGTLYVDRMLTRSLASAEYLPELGARPVSEVMDELVSPKR